MKCVRHLLLGVVLGIALSLAFASVAFAGVVEPGTYDARDIENELNETGEVTLVEGQTYTLTRAIHIMRDDVRIDATGATIQADCQMLSYAGGVTNSVLQTQGGRKGLEIIGGYWTHNSKGYNGSTFSLPYIDGITLDGLRMDAANFDGHSIELIACKNVKIINCDITGYKKWTKSSQVNEQIQIDLATVQTAPALKSNYGLSSKWLAGQTCSNITIENCKVTGCRAVCVNKTNSSNKKYYSKFHRNVTVKNCKLYGKNAEALAIFNCPKANVTGNTLITSKPGKTNAYTIGCHIAMFGKIPSSMKKDTLTVSNNTIKGGRQALQIYSHTSSKFAKATITGNKLYCKAGKKAALKATLKSIKKVASKGNKLYKW